MNFRRVTKTALQGVTALAALAFGVGASAPIEAWAARPIELVVPISPGGSIDSLVRALAEELGKRLNEPVIVLNKPGGGIAIAGRYVQEAPADGRTLMVATGTYTTAQLQPHPQFDTSGLKPVLHLCHTPSVLYVRPNLPANNLKEFLEWARKAPDGVTFGSSGVASSPHLDAEALAAAGGFRMIHVPYGGSSGSITALAGNHLDAAWASPTFKDMVHAGKIKVIVSGSAEPMADWPDLPLMDNRLLPGYQAGNWCGVFASSKTPPAVIDRVNGDLNALLSTSEVRQRFEAVGLLPDGGSVDAFARFLQAERDRVAQLVKTRNLQLD